MSALPIPNFLKEIKIEQAKEDKVRQDLHFLGNISAVSQSILPNLRRPAPYPVFPERELGKEGDTSST